MSKVKIKVIDALKLKISETVGALKVILSINDKYVF